MQNPTVGGSIDSMVEPCLSLDADQPVAALLKRVSQAPAQKGVVLIRDGRFVATLDPAQLAKHAMHREVERAGDGSARAGKVAEPARRFEAVVAASRQRVVFGVIADGYGNRGGDVTIKKK